MSQPGKYKRPESNQRSSYCAIHNVQEPATDSTYRVCFECGHVYETKQDLIDIEYETAQSYGDHIFPKTNAASILFCPLCLHDW